MPQVLVEEVHYSPLPPWPAAALGTGNSLQRLACISFADDPANWRADSPTPGAVNAGSFTVDTDHDGVPDELEFIAGTDPLNSQDFLKFDRVSTDGVNCVLEFTARSGHIYTIEKKAGLGASSKWTTVQSNLSGTDSSFTVLDPLTSAPAFYRLKVTRN